MSTQHPIWLATLLVLISLLMLTLGVCVGSAGFENVLRAIFESSSHIQDGDLAWQIVSEIRMPRTLGAWTAGALLGLSGAVAQGLFRNSLADPYLLGSASGASLGVALALTALGGSGLVSAGLSGGNAPFSMFSSSLWVRLGLTGAAFVGSVCAVLFTLLLAKGVSHTLRLLLAGVVVGVVLGAATSLVLLFSPDSLQSMQSFLLGSTAFVSWTACSLMASVLGICALSAWALARVLDVLSLGENTARSLGMPLTPLRAALVCVLALSTGTAVAQTGLIAFVGLASPHLVRAVAKVPHSQLMLLASMTGGALLCSADVLARWLITPQELPVGVLTAVLGASYLLWLMHRRSSGLTNGVHP